MKKFQGFLGSTFILFFSIMVCQASHQHTAAVRIETEQREEFGFVLKALGINLSEMERRFNPTEYKELVELLELRLRNERTIGPRTPLRKKLNVLLQKGGFHRPIPGGTELEILIARAKKEVLIQHEHVAATSPPMAAAVEAREEKALQVEESKAVQEDRSLEAPLGEEEQHVLNIVLSPPQQENLSPKDIRFFINILREEFGNHERKGKAISPLDEHIKELTIKVAAHNNPESIEIIQKLIMLLLVHQKDLQEQVVGGKGYNREDLRRHEEALESQVIPHLSPEQKKLLKEYFEELHRHWTQNHPRMQGTQHIQQHERMEPSAPVMREEIRREREEEREREREEEREREREVSLHASQMPMAPAEPVMPERISSPGLNDVERLRNSENNPFAKIGLTVAPTQEERTKETRSLNTVKRMAIGKHHLGDWKTKNGVHVKPAVDEVNELVVLKAIESDPSLLSLLTPEDKEHVKNRILELEKPEASGNEPNAPPASAMEGSLRPSLFSASMAPPTATTESPAAVKAEDQNILASLSAAMPVTASGRQALFSPTTEGL